MLSLIDGQFCDHLHRSDDCKCMACVSLDSVEPLKQLRAIAQRREAGGLFQEPRNFGEQRTNEIWSVVHGRHQGSRRGTSPYRALQAA